ncbi:MAG: prepilin-type N-terminal cleavage/methylation domain-containing protein [Candidatus Eisenbacteria sp.]|nr:prepilin-type N-terminal cleavage/methylation domain-containing protein [Candidatus Eisenbacteria bacterium]
MARWNSKLASAGQRLRAVAAHLPALATMHGEQAKRGLTLVETLIATLIMALLASATMSAGRVVLVMERGAEDSWRAAELGLGLLEEVATLPFNDPQSGGTSIGPELGEWVPPGNRALFDDVDDYSVWNGSQTLQQKDGTAINLPGYTRAVSISYVTAGDFSAVSLLPTDYKSITVSVFEKGDLVETFTTVRVEGGRDVDFDG